MYILFELIFPFRSLSIGSKSGFSLFSLSSADSSIEKIYSNYTEDICLVERLFSSSLVAVVSLNAPRKLKVRHHNLFFFLKHILITIFFIITGSA